MVAPLNRILVLQVGETPLELSLMDLSGSYLTRETNGEVSWSKTRHGPKRTRLPVEPREVPIGR